MNINERILMCLKLLSGEFYTPTNAFLYTIKYYSKMFILKHLKMLQHVSIII